MSQSELRRDNHYVPRSYLKRWGDDDGRIWTYRILVSHPNVPVWKRHSIKSIAYHRHLYTRVTGGEESDDVERWLDVEFEAAAADAIEKVVSNGRLTRADWEHLVRFLAAQDVRTPARLIESLILWRENLPADIQATLAAAIEHLETAKRDGSQTPRVTHPYGDYYPGRVTIEPLPEKQGGQIRVKTVIGRSMWLFALKHLLTKSVDVLLQHRWTILRSPPGITWLTSDDPVVRLNYENPCRYHFRGGWGSEGTEILMLLGPGHLMYTRIGEICWRYDATHQAECA